MIGDIGRVRIQQSALSSPNQPIERQREITAISLRVPVPASDIARFSARRSAAATRAARKGMAGIS